MEVPPNLPKATKLCQVGPAGNLNYPPLPASALHRLLVHLVGSIAYRVVMYHVACMYPPIPTDSKTDTHAYMTNGYSDLREKPILG